MLNKLLRSSRQIAGVRHFAGPIKQKGNFELHYEIPPRYFMVTYDIDTKVDCAEMLKSADYEEHRQIVKKNVQN